VKLQRVNQKLRLIKKADRIPLSNHALNHPFSDRSRTGFGAVHIIGPQHESIAKIQSGTAPLLAPKDGGQMVRLTTHRNHRGRIRRSHDLDVIIEPRRQRRRTILHEQNEIERMPGVGLTLLKTLQNMRVPHLL